jgi:hypothetical protein
MGRARVLLAGTQQAIDTLHSIFGDELELIDARSIDEALARLDGGIDLIICSVRFDESRMFNFLQALHERSDARGIPVICCRTAPEALSREVRRAVEMALQALGVGTFIDLAALREQFDESIAGETLRQLAAAQLRGKRT